MIFSVNFSSENLEARRQWDNVFKVLRKGLSLKTLYPTKLSFKNKGEIKIIPDKS